jgi:hypothetical protein
MSSAKSFLIDLLAVRTGGGSKRDAALFIINASNKDRVCLSFSLEGCLIDSPPNIIPPDSGILLEDLERLKT